MPGWEKSPSVLLLNHKGQGAHYQASPPMYVHCCHQSPWNAKLQTKGISDLIPLHTFSAESDSKRNIKPHIFQNGGENLVQGDKEQPFGKPVLTAHINSKVQGGGIHFVKKHQTLWILFRCSRKHLSPSKVLEMCRWKRKQGSWWSKLGLPPSDDIQAVDAN